MKENDLPVTVGILAIGLAPDVLESLGVWKEGVQIDHVVCNVDVLLEAKGPVPGFVLCGPAPEGVSIVEVAQVVRMQYSQAPIYLVVPPGSRYDRKNLVKNGFTDVFFLPLDRASAVQAIDEEIQRVRKRGRIYRPIQLVDLRPDLAVDFDTYVYLPANDKHVCYAAAGSEMGPDRVERLKKHRIAALHVAEEELPKFYAYTAKALKEIGKDGAMSETERAERLQRSVRDLISGLFSDAATATDAGKKIAEDCQNIVKNYVSNGAGGNWYSRLLAAGSSGSDTYSRAASTSTYAGLFAIGLALPNVEDVALAGLLHDIGLAKVDAAGGEAEYRKHPDYTVDLIRDRKLVVSALVIKTIQQHHEAFDGSGYPKGLAGSRICTEAQIVAFADRFTERLEVKPGQPAKSPAAALAELRRELLGDAAKSPIDPALVKRILALFPNSESESSMPVAA
ncbi:MAG: HD domain-containing protein [Bdellovibrionales bacterium]|nr:HD domain-containing protein [Bdellovibrionales bacterium]